MKTTLKNFLHEKNEYKGDLNKLFNLTSSEMKLKWREIENSNDKYLSKFMNKYDINDIINTIPKNKIYDISKIRKTDITIKDFIENLISMYREIKQINKSKIDLTKYNCKESENFKICKIDDYETSKKLGSTKWDIVYSDIFFNEMNKNGDIYFVFRNDILIFMVYHNHKYEYYTCYDKNMMSMNFKDMLTEFGLSKSLFK